MLVGYRQRDRDLTIVLLAKLAAILPGDTDRMAALQIHSVEARHVSSVRLVVGKSGSEGAFDKPMSKNEVLEAGKPFFV